MLDGLKKMFGMGNGDDNTANTGNVSMPDAGGTTQDTTPHVSMDETPSTNNVSEAPSVSAEPNASDATDVSSEASASTTPNVSGEPEKPEVDEKLGTVTNTTSQNMGGMNATASGAGGAGGENTEGDKKEMCPCGKDGCVCVSGQCAC